MINRLYVYFIGMSHTDFLYNSFTAKDEEFDKKFTKFSSFTRKFSFFF